VRRYSALSKTNNTNYARNLAKEIQEGFEELERTRKVEVRETENTDLADYVKTIKKGGRLA
tara:strand:- start:4319 stop:4501 length:183 start_codon:yes stop_codon:yes gene_type:complete